MSEETIQETENKQVNPAPNTAPSAADKGGAPLACSVITIIFSIGVLLFTAMFAFSFGLSAGAIASGAVDLEGAGFSGDWDQVADMISSVGFGSVSTAEAVVYSCIFIAVFAFCGFVLSVLTIIAAVSAIRSRKNPEKRYASFVWSVLAAVICLLMLRLISCVLFAVSAVMLYRSADTAKDIEDFATTNRLGFMRFVQIMSIAWLAMNAAMLIFVTRSSVFSGTFWMDFISMIMMAVVAWIIATRLKEGRQIIMGMVAAYLVLDAIVLIALGEFDPINFTLDSLWPFILLIYFATSRRAKAMLVRPFRMETRREMLKEDEQLWNPKSFNFWRNLVLYFCIFSVVGHWMEWCVCWLIRWGIVPGTYDPNSGIWRDMLNPFFVYGAAMVLIGLLLFPLKNWLQKKCPNNIVALILSFLANTVMVAAIELALGFTLNQPVGTLWDYSTMDFNFMGQICLLNTTFFGVMATLMTWVVYPALEKGFSRIPRDAMNIITIVVLVFFVLVVFMYVINLNMPNIEVADAIEIATAG
ncbi:MAG: putative ABC transporter permease [Coriobacteriia bacterium]|nr:putative ABC transporter permease [Coriobacteriia bacterium]